MTNFDIIFAALMTSTGFMSAARATSMAREIVRSQEVRALSMGALVGLPDSDKKSAAIDALRSMLSDYEWLVSRGIITRGDLG